MNEFWKQKMDFFDLDKIFVLDNLNFVQDKKYFVQDKKYFVPDKKFCPGQNRFCPWQKILSTGQKKCYTIFLILSPFYSLCFLIPSQYFSTVSLHFSTIFKYCECIFPWNFFSVKKNPIFFTETSECIFPWNYFSNFYRIWISTTYKCLGLREFSREVLSTY